MNRPDNHAGRLERRVRLVGRETWPGVLGFCSLPLLSIFAIANKSVMSNQKLKNRILYKKNNGDAVGIDCDKVIIEQDTLSIFNDGNITEEIHLEDVKEIWFTPKQARNLSC